MPQGSDIPFISKIYGMAYCKITAPAEGTYTFSFTPSSVPAFYYGVNVITLNGTEIANCMYFDITEDAFVSYNKPSYYIHSFTITLNEGDVLVLGISGSGAIDFGEGEGDPIGNENEIKVGEEKSFEGASYYNVLVYDLKITDSGDYNFTIGGENAADIILHIGTEYDEEMYDVTEPLDANADGSYTLAAGTTYKVVIYSEKIDMTTSSGYAELDGTVKVSKAGVVENGSEIALNQNVTVQGASYEEPLQYTIVLSAGSYQVLVDGSAAGLCGMEDDIWVRNSNGDMINGDSVTVINVDASSAGTYTIEVYADITFTVVEKTA